MHWLSVVCVFVCACVWLCALVQFYWCACVSLSACLCVQSRKRDWVSFYLIKSGCLRWRSLGCVCVWWSACEAGCVVPCEGAASTPPRVNLFVWECRSTNKHLHMQKKICSKRSSSLITQKHIGIIIIVVQFRILSRRVSHREVNIERTSVTKESRVFGGLQYKQSLLQTLPSRAQAQCVFDCTVEHA
jgi:hypothetical protein